MGPFKRLIGSCFAPSDTLGGHAKCRRTASSVSSDVSSMDGTHWSPTSSSAGYSDDDVAGHVDDDVHVADDRSNDGAAEAAAAGVLGAKYLLASPLNRGAQGWVVKAVDVGSGETVAIKLLERGTRLSIDTTCRELVNHAALQGHPHIVGLRHVYLTPDYLALVMDYADRGDLSEHLSKHVFATGRGLPEPAAKHIFQQVATAVDWAHRAGIAVRDIKLDNILLHGAADVVTLADFGWSCSEAEGDRKKAFRACGTPEYIAPEIILRRGGYDAQAADVWAAGVLLWALVSGGFAFLRPDEEALEPAARMRAMAPRIVTGAYRTLPVETSPELQDLIRRMLEVDVRQRITIAEVARHPWVAADMPPQLASLNRRLAAIRSGASGSWCGDAAPAGGPAAQAFGQSSSELWALVQRAVAPVGAPPPVGT